MLPWRRCGMKRRLVLIAVGFAGFAWLSACGNATHDGEGSGGSGGVSSGGRANTDAGSGGFGGAGGTPAPPTRVGITINVTQSASCPTGSGLPDDLGTPPPDSTGSGRGQPATDGEAGTEAFCTIRSQSSGAFAVEAIIASVNPRLAFSLQSGTVNSNGTGTGSISLTTAGVGATVVSPIDAPCTLSVIAPVAQNLKPGALWARFECPRLVSAPSLTCSASGELVLENCAQ